VGCERLEAVRSNLRYSNIMGLDTANVATVTLAVSNRAYGRHQLPEQGIRRGGPGATPRPAGIRQATLHGSESDHGHAGDGGAQGSRPMRRALQSPSRSRSRWPAPSNRSACGRKERRTTATPDCCPRRCHRDGAARSKSSRRPGRRGDPSRRPSRTSRPSSGPAGRTAARQRGGAGGILVPVVTKLPSGATAVRDACELQRRIISSSAFARAQWTIPPGRADSPFSPRR